MPDVLAIQWDKRRLRIVEASTGGTTRVIQSFVADVPESPTKGWLRDVCRQHSVSARQAIICLPREDAILRQMELPDAPDDELPTLVHFQASTRSTTPLDQLNLDYLPLPRRPGTIQRDVLLASAPRTIADSLRLYLTEAGIELIALSVSSFALAELAMRVPDHAHDESRLVVFPDAQRLEVVLVSPRGPLAAHLVRPPLDDAGKPSIVKAAADISRVLVPAQPWLSESPIQQIWVLGDPGEWEGLDQALRERWNCPVDRFDSRVTSRIRDLDSAKLDGSVAQYAVPLGAVLTRSGARSPVLDLLHPRQPKPKRDPRKLRMTVGAAAALLVVALVMGVYQTMMQSLDNQISEGRTELATLTGRSKVGEPIRKAATLIEDWKTRDVNQLNEFVELYDLMQGTSRLYLSEYNFSPTNSPESIAKLNASGNAKERIDWQQLAQRLADAGRYRVTPREGQIGRDSDYPNRFEVVTDLIPPGKQSVAAGPATPATGTTATGTTAGTPSREK